jgi:hypothetical protein
VSNQDLLVLVELDILDNRLLDPQQGAPYSGVLHAVLRSVVPVLRQLRNLDRERRAHVPAALNHPRKSQKSLF